MKMIKVVKNVVTITHSLNWHCHKHELAWEENTKVQVSQMYYHL